MSNINVKISGSCFSSLQYELINNDMTQEGFLLGQIEKHYSHSISDSQIDVENTDIVINISGYIPCSKVLSFYSGTGRVNDEDFGLCTRNKNKEIVGWYRCRRFSNTPFLREIMVHSQLMSKMQHCHDNFLFALFSRDHAADSGTLDVTYKFLVMTDESDDFNVVPVQILNMKDTSSSMYLEAPPPSDVFYRSPATEKILQNIQNLEPGVTEAEIVHSDILNQLQTTFPEFAELQMAYKDSLNRVKKIRQLYHHVILSERIENKKEVTKNHCVETPSQGDNSSEVLSNGHSNQTDTTRSCSPEF